MSLTESLHLTRHAQDRRRAFVVDDDPGTRRLLGDVAGELGWESERFASLRSLRAALEHDVPDLIILDDELPDGRGGDFAIEARSSTRLRRTPIIFCTAATPDRRREIGRLAPVLGKPFDLERFERLLDEVA